MGVDIQIKRYALGKYTFITKGRTEYLDTAKRAFSASCNLIPNFDKDQFTQMMRENNAPEVVIKEYLENSTIKNEVTSSDHPEIEMMGDISSKFIISGK